MRPTCFIKGCSEDSEFVVVVRNQGNQIGTPEVCSDHYHEYLHEDLKEPFDMARISWEKLFHLPLVTHKRTWMRTHRRYTGDPEDIFRPRPPAHLEMEVADE